MSTTVNSNAHDVLREVDGVGESFPLSDLLPTAHTLSPVSVPPGVSVRISTFNLENMQSLIDSGIIGLDL